MVNRVLCISVVTIFAPLPLTAQNPQLHIQKNNEAVRIEGSESWLSFFEGNQGKAFMQNYQGDLYLGTLSTNLTGKIRFYNNNSTKMIIDPNGNVGIGTDEPGSKLTVFGNTNTAIAAESVNAWGVYGYSHNDVGVYGLSLEHIGVLGEGATWDFYAGGGNMHYGMASSRRWKNNIINIDNPLEKIGALRGVYFDWDEAHGGRHDVGFIAEEIGEILPEIVHYEENGIDADGMDYSKMTSLLVEAINALRQEYQAEIKLLKSQIIQQNEKISSLEQTISKSFSLNLSK